MIVTILLTLILLVQLIILFWPFLPLSIVKQVNKHIDIEPNTLMVPYQLVQKYEDVISEMEQIARVRDKQLQNLKDKNYVDKKVHIQTLSK